MPSPQSILVKNWAWLFRPYLNSLTINTTWNLFSPDPASATYLKIHIISEKEETGERIQTIPRFAADTDRDPRYKRDLYMMRYLIMSDHNIQTYLIPHLCKENPDAKEIRLEVFNIQSPSLEVASLKKLYSVSEMKQLRVLKEAYGMCEANL